MSIIKRMQSMLALLLLFAGAAVWSQETAEGRANVSSARPLAAAANSTAPKQIEQEIKAGRIDAARSAVASFQQDVAATSEQKTAASLSYANQLLRTEKSRPSSDPSLYVEAETHLRKAIVEGTPEQQLLARNNLAVSKLANGDRQTAVQLLSDGVATANALKDPTMRSQYFFNYARILERAGGEGRLSDASASYRQAFVANPQRAEAAIAGGKLALARDDSAAAADFMRLLATSGHLSDSESLLRAAMTNESGRPLAGDPEIVAVLFDLLPALHLSRADFNDKWQPYLSSNALRNNERAKTTASFLQLGFAPQEAIPLARRSELLATLGGAGWSKDQLVKPADYFTKIGAQRAADGELRAAYGLYSAAFQLNSTNIDAALYKANLLLEHPDAIDPDGSRLDGFVSELFQGKGEAYLGNDWPNILRFHTVLGTIFYKQKRWGEAYDPRGAIFQLEHARTAKQQVAKGADGSNLPAAGLFAMLGDCYVAKKKPALAFDAYLSAASDAVLAADKPQARAILNQKLSGISNYTPSPQQAAALEKIRMKL